MLPEKIEEKKFPLLDLPYNIGIYTNIVPFSRTNGGRQPGFALNIKHFQVNVHQYLTKNEGPARNKTYFIEI